MMTYSGEISNIKEHSTITQYKMCTILKMKINQTIVCREYKFMFDEIVLLNKKDYVK